MSLDVIHTSPTSTRAEQVSDLIARSLAQHISRRSFLGRLGKGVVAVSLGAAGAEALLRPPTAMAITCDVNGCSIQCSQLNGWNQNSCPTGTCECGCWCLISSNQGCPNSHKQWCDCCGGGWCGAPGHGCHCQTAGCNGKTYPTCCYTKEWTGQGCGDSSWHIACRKSDCRTSGCNFSDECLGAAC
jgi:hypothetical protein